MKTYTVQGPSGKTYKVEGPENATADELGEFILSQSKPERDALQMQKDREEYSPTKGMSGGELMRAGLGGGVSELGRGIGQWLGITSRDEVKEARRLDAPLDATTEGKIGKFLGKAAPVAAASIAIPGMASLGGATALGAAAGAAEPSESTRETILNLGIGTASGFLGQLVGNKVADALKERARKQAADFLSKQAAGAQKLNVARAAAQEGYVIPPSDVQPQGKIVEALGGLSGKVKTAQVASAQNQQVTDKLAKQALGLAPDAPLDTAVLDGIRKQAGQAYGAISQAGTVVPNAAYTQALDDALKPFTSQANSFPGRKVPEVVSDISALKTQAFDAGDAVQTISVLRNDADIAYRSGNNMAGKAYKKAADAMEQAIDDHLVAAGAPSDLLKQYREARTLIAKTYSVQKALNPQTGEVSAQVLARELGKGKPLSGELKKIAQVGQAFPKATQSLKEAPKSLSPLDWAMTGLAATSSGGSPLSAAGLLARPGVRSLLLSGPAQKSAMKDLAPPTAALANAADSELMRLLYGPVAVGAGLSAVNGR
jgi:hypothetical protein